MFCIQAGCGIFSFYEIENKQLYSSTKSVGVIHGSLKYCINEKFSLSAWGGYENLKCIIKNSPNKYYVNRYIILSRIDYNLTSYKNLDLYLAASGGILQEDKHLYATTEKTMQIVYDFVFLGLKLNASQKIGIYFETGYCKLSLFRAGFFMTL